MLQIECDKIAIGYDKKIVVKDLSFSVNQGDYLCIVGENGAGKSTLIKTILGLIPCIQGQINYKNGLTNRDIGYLPQQTMVQKDFPATIMEVVMSGFQNRCKLRPFYNKNEKSMAMSNLKKLGMDNLVKRCYRELSGGQQQRVLLARALCATEKMLLLDEPTSGLDPIATEDMYNLIQKLNNEGITVIMISHDIPSAIKYASHILYIKNEPYFDVKENFVKSELGKKCLTYLDVDSGVKNNG